MEVSERIFIHFKNGVREVTQKEGDLIISEMMKTGKTNEIENITFLNSDRNIIDILYESTQKVIDEFNREVKELEKMMRKKRCLNV